MFAGFVGKSFLGGISYKVLKLVLGRVSGFPGRGAVLLPLIYALVSLTIAQAQ